MESCVSAEVADRAGGELSSREKEEKEIFKI